MFSLIDAGRRELKESTQYALPLLNKVRPRRRGRGRNKDAHGSTSFGGAAGEANCPDRPADSGRRSRPLFNILIRPVGNDLINVVKMTDFRHIAPFPIAPIIFSMEK